MIPLIPISLTPCVEEARTDACGHGIDGSVIYWHLDNFVIRPSAMTSMHERLFPGRPADGVPPPPDLVASASAIFVFTDACSAAVCERIDAALPPDTVDVPIIVPPVRTRTIVSNIPRRSP